MNDTAPNPQNTIARDRIAMVVNNNTRVAEAGRKVLDAIDKDPSLDEALATIFNIQAAK